MYIVLWKLPFTALADSPKANAPLVFETLGCHVGFRALGFRALGFRALGFQGLGFYVSRV